MKELQTLQNSLGLDGSIFKKKLFLAAQSNEFNNLVSGRFMLRNEQNQQWILHA